MNSSQFVSVLLARWRLLIAVPAIAILCALIITALMPKRFTATAIVLVEGRGTDPLLNNAAHGPGGGHMATQIDILTSEPVAMRVSALMRLTESPALQDNWRSATNGQGSFEAWIAGWVRRGLTVRPSRESRVVSIQYEAEDPQFAVAAANAFAQAYMETNVGLRVAPAKQYSSFFDQRLSQARAQLEAAQKKLSEYQKDAGIITTDERLDVETARLNDLSNQLVVMRTLSAEANSRALHGASKGAVLADVLANPVVSGLTAELNRNQARLEEVRARYGEAHPQVREIQANLDALRHRIETESQRVLRSVALNNTINQTREAEVRAAYEAQRSRVLRLKEQRDELTVLEKDVANAQRNYELMQSRHAQVTMESENSTPSVSLLGSATLPSSPSYPNRFLNLLAAGALGCAFGVAVVLFRELRDRRIRISDDVVHELGLPLLAEMSIPRALQLPWRKRNARAQWLLPHSTHS